MARSELEPEGTDDADEVQDLWEDLDRGTRNAVQALRRLRHEHEAVDEDETWSALELLLRGTELEGRAADVLARWRDGEGDTS